MGKRRSGTTWTGLGRLCVRRDRGGQGELKSCTTPAVTGGPQSASMRLNDRSTDGQPHAGPVNLGGKECLEDLLASASRSFHGIDPVEHKVHENLLQLDTVGHDLGKILSKLDTD